MRYFIFSVTLMLCSAIASAVDMPVLAKKKNCTGCHAIERKIVGPSWLDVAKRYKGNNEAPLFLANKIKVGGFGIWGVLRMPEQNLTNEEADKLAKFILELSDEPPLVASGR